MSTAKDPLSSPRLSDELRLALRRRLYISETPAGHSLQTASYSSPPQTPKDRRPDSRLPAQLSPPKLLVPRDREDSKGSQDDAAADEAQLVPKILCGHSTSALSTGLEDQKMKLKLDGLIPESQSMSSWIASLPPQVVSSRPRSRKPRLEGWVHTPMPRGEKWVPTAHATDTGSADAAVGIALDCAATTAEQAHAVPTSPPEGRAAGYPSPSNGPSQDQLTSKDLDMHLDLLESLQDEIYDLLPFGWPAHLLPNGPPIMQLWKDGVVTFDTAEDFIEQARDKSRGYHISRIEAHFAHIDPWLIGHALKALEEDGLIYSTVDDEHFLALESDDPN